ncbi:MAG TPA: DUF59 domain-containing protein [Candidatus Krumholzibacteria bacterium]|nr:DUF59 domain-containing protein [Candidatus Krumholzibacteria bacterium]
MENPTAKPEATSAERNDAVEPSSTNQPVPAAAGMDRDALRARIVEVMQSVFDPEIPVNIYELGMVYDIAVDDAANAVVTMTLTSPMCPVAGSLPGEVETKVAAVAGLASARVDLVWEPAWTPERMSEAAKLQLGMM